MTYQNFHRGNPRGVWAVAEKYEEIGRVELAIRIGGTHRIEDADVAPRVCWGERPGAGGTRAREEILWGEFETGRLMGVGMSEGVQQLYRKIEEMR